VEVLQQLGTISLDSWKKSWIILKEHLQAEKAFLELRFPYFITKKAPVSGMQSLMDLDCVYRASKGKDFCLTSV
jgi:GTP cyclohydrolase I